MMTGRRGGQRGTTLLGVLFALAIIQMTHGNPRSRPNYLSYDEHHPSPLASSSSNVDASLTETFSDVATEIASEIQPVDYSEPLTYGSDPEVTRVIEIAQEEERVGSIASSDEEPDDTEKDEEDEEPDDTEVPDNIDVRDAAIKVEEPDVKVKYDETGSSIDDDIKRLLHEAMAERIFLTPEEWQSQSDGQNPTGTNPEIDDRTTSDQTRTTFLDNVADVPVPKCRDSTFCADVPYYPSDEFIENALRINYVEPISDPSMISQRMGPADISHDDVLEQSLCESRPEELQPVSGEDDQQEWHYVLNNKKYVQKVNVELCQNAGGTCRILDPLAQGYTTFCKQTHFYRHLVVISKNGTAQTKPIKLPSSCCCHVKFNADPLTRVGVRLRNNQTPAPTRRNN